MSQGASNISGANNIPLGVRSEAGYLAAAASTLGGISLLNPSYHLGDNAPPPPVSENVYEWSQNIVLGSLDPWLNGKFEPQGTLKRTLDNDDDHENNNKKPKLDIVLVQGLKRSAEEEVQVSDGKKAKLEPSLDIDAPNPQTVVTTMTSTTQASQNPINLKKDANRLRKGLLKISKCQTCDILISYRDSKTLENHIENCVKYSNWLIIQDQYQCKVCQEKMTVWTSAFDHVEKMHYKPQLEMEKKAAAIRQLSYAKLQIEHIVDNVHTDIIEKISVENHSSELRLAINELRGVLAIQLKRLRDFEGDENEKKKVKVYH